MEVSTGIPQVTMVVAILAWSNFGLFKGGKPILGNPMYIKYAHEYWHLNSYSSQGNIMEHSPFFFVDDLIVFDKSHTFQTYPLVMTNSSPWKIHPFLIGKPSISMGHLYHGYVK
jgi:hypothetical protein